MSKDTYSPITMYYPLRLPFYCIGFITVNSSATFQSGMLSLNTPNVRIGGDFHPFALMLPAKVTQVVDSNLCYHNSVYVFRHYTERCIHDSNVYNISVG